MYFDFDVARMYERMDDMWGDIYLILWCLEGKGEHKGEVVLYCLR